MTFLGQTTLDKIANKDLSVTERQLFDCLNQNNCHSQDAVVHPNMTPRLLDIAAQSESGLIAIPALKHQNTALGTYYNAIRSNDPIIRETAMQHAPLTSESKQSLMTVWKTESSPSVKSSLVKRAEWTADELRYFYEHGDKLHELSEIAEHKNTPPDILNILASSDNSSVALLAKENPNYDASYGNPLFASVAGALDTRL